MQCVGPAARSGVGHLQRYDTADGPAYADCSQRQVNATLVRTSWGADMLPCAPPATATGPVPDPPQARERRVLTEARLRAAHERIGAAACAHALPADPPASSAYFRANRRFARVFVFLARLSCSRLFFKIDQPLQWTAAQAACVEQVRVLTRTARRRHAGAILHKRAPHPTRCQARPRSRQVRRAGSAGEGAWDAVHTVCLHSPNAGLALLGRDAVQGGDLASIHSDEEFAAAVSDGQGGSGRTRRGVSHRV